MESASCLAFCTVKRLTGFTAFIAFVDTMIALYGIHLIQYRIISQVHKGVTT